MLTLALGTLGAGACENAPGATDGDPHAYPEYPDDLTSDDRADVAGAASTTLGDWKGVPFVASPNIMDTRLYVPITKIIIHTTEGSYSGAIRHFQNPGSNVSAHYVIRSRDGAITQMVRDTHTGFHSGNGFYNYSSIGIEHEAVAREGRKWFTTAMLRSSARLVRSLCDRYSIPCDREHVVGHYEVPAEEKTLDEFLTARRADDESISDAEYERRAGLAEADLARYEAQRAAAKPSCRAQGPFFGGGGGHYDPGCDWNWDGFMKLVNESTPLEAAGVPVASEATRP